MLIKILRNGRRGHVHKFLMRDGYGWALCGRREIPLSRLVPVKDKGIKCIRCFREE